MEDDCGLTVEDLFYEFRHLKRVIIQFIDFSESLDESNILSGRDSHCAVLKFIKGDWHLFDSTEKKVINLSDNEWAVEWIKNLEYIDVYSMEQY